MRAASPPDALDAEVDDAIRLQRYERNEADFMRRVVQRGDSVIDLGAHVGVHTVLLADLVGPRGSVMAVEPCHAHLVRLASAVETAGAADGVTIVAAAAADEDGERSLLVSAPGQASRHAWLMPAGREAGPLDVRECVRAVRVDDLPRSRRVTFMKIDVEGAESLALRGAWRLLASDRPVLLVDLHPHLIPIVSGESADACITRLSTLGYRCCLLGAGVPSTPITEMPTGAVTPVVFLPDDPNSWASRDSGR
jgi:FkbM family methyltransferase